MHRRLLGAGRSKSLRPAGHGHQQAAIEQPFGDALGVVECHRVDHFGASAPALAEDSAFGALAGLASTAALARSGVATLAGVVLFDEWKLEYLRRDDEAYIPQPDWVRGVVACASYGNADEVRVGAKRLLRM